MDYGKISEVVMGFKRVVANIPSQYDNFDDALEKFFDAFHQTMDEMILCGEEFEICKAISPVEFLKISHGEWDNPNCYKSDFDGVLAFVL